MPVSQSTSPSAKFCLPCSLIWRCHSREHFPTSFLKTNLHQASVFQRIWPKMSLTGPLQSIVNKVASVISIISSAKHLWKVSILLRVEDSMSCVLMWAAFPQLNSLTQFPTMLPTMLQPQWNSLVSLDYIRYTPTSGPLHVLLPLPGMSTPQKSIGFSPSFPTDLCLDVISVRPSLAMQLPSWNPSNLYSSHPYLLWFFSLALTTI